MINHSVINGATINKPYIDAQDELTDGVKTTDSAFPDFGEVFIDGVLLAHGADINEVQNVTFTDIANTADALVDGLHIAITDAAKVSDTLATMILVYAAFSEIVNVSDSNVPMDRLFDTLTDGAVTTENMWHGFEELLADGITIADVQLMGLVMFLSDTTDMSDVVTGLHRELDTLLDKLVISSTLTVQEAVNAILSEGVIIGGALRLPQLEQDVWVINTNTAGVTRYAYPTEFNSFADNLAAADDGIYLREGADDDGTDIETLITTDALDFGTSVKKRFLYAYLGFTSDNTAVLKVRTSADGTLYEDWYECTKTVDTPESGRFKLGRGLFARYAQFSLINTDGGDLDIKSFEAVVVPVRTKRRL